MYSCLTGVQHYYRHTRLQYPKCWCFFWAIIHSQARTFKKRCLCSGEVNTFSCYIYMSVPNSHYHISNMTDNVHNNSLPHKSAWRKSISLFSGSVRIQFYLLTLSGDGLTLCLMSTIYVEKRKLKIHFLCALLGRNYSFDGLLFF